MSANSLKLIISDKKTGQRQDFNLEAFRQWVAQPGANYTVVQQSDGKPAKAMMLRRVKNNLVVEVDGQTVAEIEGFYAEFSSSTFTTDGSPVVAQAPTGAVISSSTGAAATADSINLIVWPPVDQGAIGLVQSGLSSPLAMVGGVLAGAIALAPQNTNTSTPAPVVSLRPSAPTGLVRDPSDDTDPANGVIVRLTLAPDAKAGDSVVYQLYRDGTLVGGELTQTLTAPDIQQGYTTLSISGDGVTVDGTYGFSAHIVGTGGTSDEFDISRVFIRFTGSVQDDYFANSIVFIDFDGDGRWSADMDGDLSTADAEPYTLTDALGRFSFLVDPGNARIIAVGGIDTNSGAPSNNVTFISSLASVTNPQANSLSMVLSPLSTLIASVAQQMSGGTGTVNSAQLIEAANVVNTTMGLGLSDPGQLLKLDVAAGAFGPTANEQSINLLSVNRQLGAIMSASSSLIAGASAARTNGGRDTDAGLLISDILADMVVQSSERQTQLDLVHSNNSTNTAAIGANLSTLFNTAMQQANESGLTSDLRASNDTDVDMLTDALSIFTSRISTSTNLDPGSDQAASAMRSVSDVLLPVLRQAGAEATTDRGGDLSFSSIVEQTVRTQFADAQAVQTYVNTAVTSVLANLNNLKTHDVKGSTGQILALDIQVPVLDKGQSIDNLVIAGVPKGVSVLLVNTLTKAETMLSADAQGNYIVKASEAGFLAIRALETDINSQKVTRWLYTDNSLQSNWLTITATQGTGPQTVTVGEASRVNLTINPRPVVAQATITQVLDDVGELKGTVRDHGTTDDAMALINGSVNTLLGAGEKLMLTFSRVVLTHGVRTLVSLQAVEVAVASDKSWSYQVPAALLDGQYLIAARTVDASGNTLAVSQPQTFTVDTVAPSVPQINPSGGRVINGSAETGSTVQLSVSGQTVSLDVDDAGKWTYSPSIPLVNGTSISAVVTDAAGNTSVPAVGVVQVGVPTQMVSLDQSSYLLNAQTQDFKISGTLSTGLQASESLKIYAKVGDSVELLQGTFTITGTTWSFVPSQPVDASYQLFASVINTSGLEGARTDVVSMLVNRTPPTQTVTLSPAPQDDVGLLKGNIEFATSASSASSLKPTDDATPSVTGALSSALGTDEVLAVYVSRVTAGVLNQARLGYATVSDTTWSFSFKAPLSDGVNSISARVEDSAGNASSFSEAQFLVVDTIAPAGPGTAADLPLDADSGSSGTDSITNVARPGLAIGALPTGFAGALLLVNGQIVDATYVAQTGMLMPEQSLPDGRLDLSYQYFDAAGNLSKITAPTLSLTVDTALPIVSFGSVTDDITPQVGTVANGGSTNDTVLSIAGTAEVGSTVKVYDGSTLVGTATADSNGAWSLSTSTLANGSHALKAQATDAAGNVGPASEVFNVTVDTGAPAAPAIGTVSDDVSPQTGTVANGGSTNDKVLSVAGTAEAGSTVKVYDGSTLVGTATADSNGAWSLSTSTLAEGSYALTAQATDAAGNVSPASEVFNVTVDTGAPAAPAIGTVSDDVSPQTGTVANGGSTNDKVLSVAGTAEAGSTVKVYDGSTLVGTATADSNGAWSLSTSTLAEGSHALTARASDAAGNVSPASEAFNVTVDLQVQTGQMAVFAADGSTLADGGVLSNSSTFSLSVLGQESSGTVLKYQVSTDGGQTWQDIAESQVNQIGLDEGSYTYHALVRDAAGNEAYTEDFTLTVAQPNLVGVSPGRLSAYSSPSGDDMIDVSFVVHRSSLQTDPLVSWQLQTTMPGIEFDGSAVPGGVIYAQEWDGLSATVTVRVKASLTQEEIRSLSLIVGAGQGYVVDPVNAKADAEIVDFAFVPSENVRIGVTLLTTTDGQTFASSDGVLKEQAEGTNTELLYTLQRSSTSGSLTLTYTLVPSGAALLSGDDFADGPAIDGQSTALSGLPTGEVTFEDGTATAIVRIFLKGDDSVGPDEAFQLALSDARDAQNDPVAVSIVGASSGQILNDDAYLSVASQSVDDAGEGSVTHSFVVTRSGDTSATHTVYYTIQGVGEQATDRYNTSEPVALVFEAGDLVKEVSFTAPTGQPLAGFQTFAIALQAQAGDNITLLNDRATSRINPNLQDIELTAGIDRVLEGSAASFSYTVTRSGAIDKALTLAWSVEGTLENGAAAADFEGGQLPSGTVSFAAGVSSASISFKTAQDPTLEGDEGFLLKLSPVDLPAGVRILDSYALGYTVDDESAVGFNTASVFSKAEGDTGTSSLAVTVSRIGFTGNVSSVQWRVSPGTASLADFASGQDQLGDNGGYPSGTLTLLPGEASGIASIRLAVDSILESDETFTVTLANASAGTKLIGTDATLAGYAGSATAVIANDDSVISVKTATVAYTEGQGGSSGFVALTLTREGSTVGSDSVKWTLTGAGESTVDNADLGQPNSALAAFTQHQNSWINFATLSGNQSVEGSITLPKSGYIMVAYNRDLAYTDSNGINMPFDQFLLKSMSLSSGATLTALGSVSQSNFIGNDVAVSNVNTLVFSNESGTVLPNAEQGGSRVVISSEQSLAGLYFKVVGTDSQGNAIEEVVRGPGTGSVSTAQHFASVKAVQSVAAGVALGALWPAVDYEEEHRPDYYFNERQVNILGGSVNLSDDINYSMSSLRQGAMTSGDNDSTYLTISSEADLSQAAFRVTGGISLAYFDRTPNDYRQDYIDNSPGGRRPEVDAPAKVHAEQVSGIGQSTDERADPNRFMVTGVNAAGQRVSEMVVVPDFVADGLAFVQSYVSGNLLGATATLGVPGRVIISSSDASSIRFTITGTDAQGQAIQETIQGPQGGVVSSATSKTFATVSAITASEAFEQTFLIGSTHPVETVNVYKEVYAVAPVDAEGLALDNNQMQGNGRIEFTMPKEFIIDGAQAGVRLSVDMVNYIDRIEVISKLPPNVSIDIGFDRDTENESAQNMLVVQPNGSTVSASINHNLEYTGNKNNLTGNPLAYADENLGYAVFRVDAPSASASSPVTLSFDVAQLGRLGIDTSRLGYAPEGTWSTSAQAMDDNGDKLLFTALTPPPIYTVLTVDDILSNVQAFTNQNHKFSFSTPDYQYNNPLSNAFDGDPNSQTILNPWNGYRGEYSINFESSNPVLVNTLKLAQGDSTYEAPKHVLVYGSNTSTNLDDMTQIASVELEVPNQSYAAYPNVVFDNSTSYKYYRLVFDQMNAEPTANDNYGYWMRLGEVELSYFQEPGDPAMAQSWQIDDVTSGSVQVNVDVANGGNWVSYAKYVEEGGSSAIAWSLVEAGGVRFSGQSLEAQTSVAYADGLIFNVSVAMPAGHTVLTVDDIVGNVYTFTNQNDKFSFSTPDNQEESLANAFDGNPDSQAILNEYNDRGYQGEYSINFESSDPVLVNALKLVTGDSNGDAPKHVLVYGSNTSTDLDDMTQIASLDLEVPSQNYAAYPDVVFANSTSYKYYRLVFDQMNGESTVDSNNYYWMRLGEMQLSYAEQPDPATAQSWQIDDVTAGSVQVNVDVASGGNWVTYAKYVEEGGSTAIALSLVAAGGVRFAGQSLGAQTSVTYDDGSIFNVPVATTARVGEQPINVAESAGQVALSGSGYIWVRYANNDNYADGADQAFIKSLYVDGGATLQVVGQKVITNGVAMAQALGGAGDITLNGDAVSHRFDLPESFDGNLVVYVSSNAASAHLQNGVYRVVGQTADGSTVERTGSWGTTDYHGGYAGGFEEGQSIVLRGLSDLVSIESIRVGEFTEKLKDFAGWGDHSPYELYDPVISFAVGNQTSLAQDLEVPLNYGDWNSWYAGSNTRPFVPGGPFNVYGSDETAVADDIENALLGTAEQVIVNGFNFNSPSHVVLTSLDALAGRSFLVSGRDTANEAYEETVTFSQGSTLAYTTAKFASVDTITALAGQATGYVSVNNSYDYVDRRGSAQVLVMMTWNIDQPSFILSGFDLEGQFQQVVVNDLRMAEHRVLGAFTEILAFQPTSPFSGFEFGYQPVPESGYQQYVSLDLNNGTRGQDGLIDLGGEQRVMISGGSASRGLRYMVTGEDAAGQAISELIKGIAPATADGFTSGNRPASQYGATVFAITQQYFSKIDQIQVTNWHYAEAEVLPVLAIGTIGAPIGADQSVSRYGQEVPLGFAVAQFDTASRISFSSDNNLSDREFTITGTLANGTQVTEVVNGPNAGIALSTQAFMTVTNIAVDEGGAGSVKVGYTTTKGGLTDNFVVTGSGTAEDPFVGHSTNTLEASSQYANGDAARAASESDVLLYVNFNGAPAGSVNLFYDLKMQGSPGQDKLYVEYSSNIASLLQGTAYFADGEAETTILIPVAGDDRREADETMRLTLGAGSAGTTLKPGATETLVTVVNDDDVVSLNATAQAVVEGNNPSDPQTLSFTVTRLDAGTSKEVRWHLQGLSAQAGADEDAAEAEDFDATSGVVTFAQGELTATIVVQIVADRVYEGDQTFQLVLSEPLLGSGYGLGAQAAAQGSILEDDVGVSIAATETSKSEGEGEGEGNASVTHTFTVSRVGDVSQASALLWSVSATSAGNNIDATLADFGGAYLTGQALNFAAGQTSKTFTVTTQGDSEMTGDRQFTVTLAHAPGDTSDIFMDAATGVIVEDDAVNLVIDAAEVRQKEASLPEVDKTLSYTLTRQDGTHAASYQWTLLLEGDGVNSVASLEDFAAQPNALGNDGGLPSGTVSFAAGETVKTLTIMVASDALIEADEAFKLHLEGVGASVAAGQDITAYLVNDTVAYSIEVRAGQTPVDGSFNEGNGGTQVLSLTFVRAGDSGASSTLNFSLAGTGDHPITAADFVGLDGLPTDVAITFAPGQSTITRTYSLAADSLKEELETLVVTLKNGEGEAVATGTVDVINDDAELRLEVEYAVIDEGTHAALASDEATYSQLTYTVFRSGNTAQESTVEWRVTAQNGLTSDDFVGSNGQLPSGSVTFADSEGPEVSKTFTINVKKDWKYEGVSENLVLELFNPSAGTSIGSGKGTATTTVLDDDKEVGFTLNSVVQTVTESSPATVTMVNDSDYLELTYTVQRIGNDREGSQTVDWALLGKTEQGYDAAGVDAAYFWNDQTYWNNTDVVAWVNDAKASSGTLVFESNDDNTKTLTIRVHKDHYQENPEAFKIVLSNQTEGLSISESAGEATGYITDDDIALVLGSESAGMRLVQSEGQPGANGDNVYTEYSWVVQRNGLAEAVDLAWSVQGHNAWLGYWVDAQGNSQWGWTPSASADATDFDAGTLSGTLRFEASETSKTLTIRVLGDLTVESTEAFKVVFAKPDNVGDLSGLGYWSEGAPTTSYVEGVILRDEGRFGIVSAELDIDSAAAYQPDSSGTLSQSSAKPEGDAGEVSHFFKIYRDFTTSGAASVDWQVQTGYVGFSADAQPFLSHATSTAATADDFAAGQNTLAQANGLPSGRATIADGEDFVIIEVKTKADLTAEDWDGFEVHLSNASAGSTVSTYANMSFGYIANDDHPLFSIGQILPSGVNDLASSEYGSKVVSEGDTVTYTVYRSGSTTYEAKVDWSVVFPDPVSGDSTSDSNSASNYTAQASDFVNNAILAGTLTFAAGEDAKTITLTLASDGVKESWAEAFSIQLLNARWADSVPAQVQAAKTPAISAVAGQMESIVLDTDGTTAVVSVAAAQSDANLYEGTSGSRNITYTLTKTGTGAGQIGWKLVLPNYGDVASITGDTQAVRTENGYEGQHFAQGLVAFAEGDVFKTITVNLNTDKQVESDETFVFTLIDGKTVLEQGFAYGNEAQGLGSPWGLLGGDGTSNANSSGIAFLDAAGHIPDSDGLYRDSANFSVNALVKNDDGRIRLDNVIGYYPGAKVLEGDADDTVFTASITRWGRIDHTITVDYEVLDGTGTLVSGSGGTWTLAGDATNTNGNGSKSYSMGFVLGDGGNSLVEPNESYTVRFKSVSDPNVLFNQSVYDYDGGVQGDIPVEIVNDDTVWSISATTISQSESDDFRVYTFTVTRPSSSDHYQGAAVVTYRIAAGNGTYTIDANDIIDGLENRTVAIASGETSKIVQFRVNGDRLAERNETFVVELVSADHGVPHANDSSLTYTIVNDDTTVEIVNATAVSEGDADGAYFTFDVVRKGQIGDKASEVTWAVQDGTATSDDDLLGAPLMGGLSFDAGQSNVTEAIVDGYGEQTQTVQVYIKADTKPEAIETFLVSLSNSTETDGTAAGKDQASAAILNDDSTFSVVAGAAVFEADAQGQSFTISRDVATAQDQTVDWSVAGSGERAASDEDFNGLSGSVTFTGDELSKTIYVPFVNDDAAEYDESYTLTIALGDGTEGDTASAETAIGTIRNDDATLTVGFANGADRIREGSGSSTHMVAFVVYRNFNSVGTASADWTLTGDAVDAGLLTTTSGSVSFEQGQTQKTVSVAVVPNTTHEADQAFTVTLSNPTGGEILSGAGDTATATIVDDDSTVVIRPDASVLELNAASNAVVFTLDRTGSTAYDTVVGWRVVTTTNATLNAGAADFVDGTLPSGTLTLTAGQSSVELSVAGVLGDLTFEGDETFRVELLAPSSPDAGLVIDPATAIGTILDNEARVEIQSAQGSYANATPTSEGTTLTFTVVRTGYLDMASTVGWDVAYKDSEFNGTGDFSGTELPSGTVSFAAGETEKTITVVIAQDTVSELDEVFRIKLASPSTGTSVGAFNSFFKVVNEDKDQIRLSASALSVNEGEPATGDFTDYTDHVLTLSRENPLTTTTVDWSVAGTGSKPLDAARFMATTGTATFAMGELTTTFVVKVATDDMGDFDRTFQVSIANPVVTFKSGVVDEAVGAEVASGANQLTLTVLNDDPVISVNLTAANFTEGSGANGRLITFTLNRDADTAGTASVDWSLQGNGDSSVNISDFGGYWPTGTAQFNDGESVKTIQVAIAPDANYEPTEGFKVVLSNLVASEQGARITVGEAVGAITNDDTGVFVEAVSATVVEGQAVDFTISAQGLPNRSVTVYFVLEGTGLSPANVDDLDAVLGDYTFNSDKQAFEVNLKLDANGNAQKVIQVSTADDQVLGSDESFRMRVVEVVNGTVAQGRAAVEILNDDALVAISPATVSQREGESGETSYVFTLQRSGYTAQAATVSYTVQGFGDNPASEDDFVSGWTGTVSFEADQTQTTLTLVVNADAVFESDESFIVQITPESPTSSTQVDDAGAKAVGVIENDDASSLELKSLVAQAKEGTPGVTGTSTLSYEIVRNGDNSQALELSYTLSADGVKTAPDAQDIQGGLSGSVTMAAGQSRLVLNLQVLGNADAGLDRFFSLQVSAPGYADPAAVTGAILDDDSGISIAAAGTGVQLAEGDTDLVAYSFLVSRSGSNLSATTLNWAVTGIGVNAADAQDFDGNVLPSDVIVFADNNADPSLEEPVQITVYVKGDRAVENAENFRITLSQGSNADTSQALLVSSVDAVITNDDAASDGNDVIYGGAGVDLLEGLGGNDVIHGGQGADLIRGGDGDDTIYGEGGADFISGGAGNDVIHLNQGNLNQGNLNQGNLNQGNLNQGNLNQGNLAMFQPLSGQGHAADPVTSVQGGFGMDTLVFDGVSLIDLTEMPAIRSIEKFDLQVGNASQTVRLDAASMQAMFEVEDARLTIEGDANDSVEIMDMGDWSSAQQGSDVVYTHTDTGMQLLVNGLMQVNVTV